MYYLILWYLLLIIHPVASHHFPPKIVARYSFTPWINSQFTPSYQYLPHSYIHQLPFHSNPQHLIHLPPQIQPTLTIIIPSTSDETFNTLSTWIPKRKKQIHKKLQTTSLPSVSPPLSHHYYCHSKENTSNASTSMCRKTI